jgi:cystathionine gamma-synthase
MNTDPERLQDDHHLQDQHQWSLDTVAVVAGRPSGEGDPLNEPIVLASNFRSGPEYARTHGNSTWEALETAIGALEGGDCIAYASGMAAASAIIFALQPRVIVIPAVSYLGVRSLVQSLQDRSPVKVKFLTSLAVDDVRQVLIDSGAAQNSGEQESGVERRGGISDIVLWLESPANPTLEESDIAGLCALAQDLGVMTVVDSTFATPITQQPLHDGASVVLHSGTKFIGGHSDLLIGLAVTNDSQILADLRKARILYGATPGALESFLALRGVRTLPLRYRTSTTSARYLAELLSNHEAVTWVRQVGPMVSFVMRGGADQADDVCNKVQLIVPATSLGGVETTLERRQKYPGDAHVDPGLIRMSVGIEDAQDIWFDLQQALQQALQ